MAMSKTKWRRLRKVTRPLREKFTYNKQQFVEEWWREWVGKWVAHALCVASQYHEKGILVNDRREDPELRKKRVFSAVDIAKDHLTVCGPDVFRLVGIETIKFLESECTRLVACGLAPHLNNVVFRYENKYQKQLRPKQRPDRPGLGGTP